MSSFVYFIEASDSGAIKIGVSGKPEARLATLQTAHPSKLNLLLTVDGDLATEQRLHHRFIAARLSGEWFRGDVLKEFVATLSRMNTEQRQAELAKVGEPRSVEHQMNSLARWEHLRDACFTAIREFGIQECSAALTRIWGPCGRPVSPHCLVGVLEGRFNLRLEWMFWFVNHFDAVADAFEWAGDEAAQHHKGAIGELARLRLAARAELGPQYAELARKARAR